MKKHSAIINTESLLQKDCKIRVAQRVSTRVQQELLRATNKHDTFDFWLRDPLYGRDFKVYEELDEEEAKEILMPIFKAKNVDSNTSQHSKEEEKLDIDTQHSNEEFIDFKSQLKNVNRCRRNEHLLMDSEFNVDELNSMINDVAPDEQINSKAPAFKNIKDKLANFRLQYLEEPCKNKEIDELHKTYTKNEYNGYRKHHHNPKTMSKIQILLEADFEVISSKNDSSINF